MSALIEVKNLTKIFKTKQKQKGLLGSIRSLYNPNYKTITAVDNISFSIEKGEIVGFIGPNGAGKSTTLKMLTGILHPSEGKMNVISMNPSSQRKILAFKLGSVFGQKSQLWYHLPAIDTYELFSKIYEIEPKTYQRRLKYLVSMFEIEEFLNQPVRKLSLGQRMRCELVAALLHNPEIILLDEPTIGLDIISKRKLRETIIEFNKKHNTTIIFTSHDIGDIESVCKRIIIINHGRIIYDNTLEKLKEEYLQKKLIEIRVGNEIKKTSKIKGSKIIKEDKYEISYEIDLSKIEIDKFIVEVTEHFRENNIKDINISNISVEEVITEIYERK